MGSTARGACTGSAPMVERGGGKAHDYPNLVRHVSNRRNGRTKAYGPPSPASRRL